MVGIRGKFLGAAALVALSAAPASAKLFVFGDSFSDNGNLNIVTNGAQPGPNYWAGRFTNGWTMAERLAFRLTGQELDRVAGLGNFSRPPSQALGGYDFAHGGATAQTRSTLPRHLSVYEQVREYRIRRFGNKLPVSAADSALIWAGANDFLAYGATSGSVTSAWVSGAVSLIDQTGVGKIVILNLPKLGNLPGWYDSADRARLNTVSSQHNSVLNTRINALRPAARAQLIVVDIALAVDLAQQGVGGFTVTRPGQNGSASGNCLGDGKVLWSCTDNYLFYDYVHFSRSGHEYLTGIVYDRMMSGAALSARGAMTAQSGAALAATQARLVETRLDAAVEGTSGVMMLPLDGGDALALADAPAGGLSVFGFDSGAADQLLFSGGDSLAGAGADWREGGWIAGASFFASDSSALSDGAAQAEARHDGAGVTAYAAYLGEEWRSDISYTHFAGQQEFRRATAIASLPYAFGETRVEDLAISAGGQRTWRDGAWSLTGDARAFWLDARADAFSERGTLGLSDNQYEAQSQQGLNGRLGLRAAYDASTFAAELGFHYIARLDGEAPLLAAAPEGLQRTALRHAYVTDPSAAIPQPDEGVSVWGAVSLAGENRSYQIKAEGGFFSDGDSVSGAAMLTGRYTF
jgi:phospholipase/lecithinase/hemolysin